MFCWLVFHEAILVLVKNSNLVKYVINQMIIILTKQSSLFTSLYVSKYYDCRNEKKERPKKQP